MTNEILAIDKFICEANNFETISYEWGITHYDYNGEIQHYTYAPRFITEVKWTCGKDHMVEKWHQVCQNTDTYGFFIKFYCELDSENKERMLQWILDNREKGYMR